MRGNAHGDGDGGRLVAREAISGHAELPGSSQGNRHPARFASLIVLVSIGSSVASGSSTEQVSHLHLRFSDLRLTGN